MERDDLTIKHVFACPICGWQDESKHAVTEHIKECKAKHETVVHMVVLSIDFAQYPNSGWITLHAYEKPCSSEVAEERLKKPVRLVVLGNAMSASQYVKSGDEYTVKKAAKTNFKAISSFLDTARMDLRALNTSKLKWEVLR